MAPSESSNRLGEAFSYTVPAAEGGECRQDTIQCTGPKGRSVEKVEEKLSLSERVPPWLPPSESPKGRAPFPPKLAATRNYRAKMKYC